MLPLEKIETGNVIGLFFDIDDTFSTDGQITASAYSALWILKNAGKIVVPVTGRPAGWCDHIARMWPVTAIIGENGAFYFMMKSGKIEKHYAANIEERKLCRKKLDDIKEEVLKTVPKAGLASDQAYREFDMAIDHREDVAPLTEDEVEKVLSICRKHGAETKLSSIHVNCWFGTYDKLTTTKLFIKQELGLDPDRENKKFIFIGDSPNDEPMFKYFEKSVGVANVLPFKDKMASLPKYITTGRSGTGFAELAKRISASVD